MLSVKPLNQRNPAWASVKIGKTDKTIGLYGCTLTSLTVLLNFIGYNETPVTVNAALNRVGGFSGALIVWGAIKKAFPKAQWFYRDYNYNNAKVWWQINVKHVPVLVEVNGAKIGGSKHWVLFIGDQKCADPWMGKLVPTSTYPLTGDSLFNKV